MAEGGGIESIIHYKDRGLEHISRPVYRVLEGILIKLVHNFGEEKVIEEYINPVLDERKASNDILEYLEFVKIILSSNLNKEKN